MLNMANKGKLWSNSHTKILAHRVSLDNLIIKQIDIHLHLFWNQQTAFSLKQSFQD